MGAPEVKPTKKRRVAKRIAGVAALAIVALAVALGVGAVRPIREPRRLPPLEGLRIDTARATQNVARYVRIDTTNPPGIVAEEVPAYARLLVEAYAAPLGLEHEVIDGRMLLIRWRARGSRLRPVLFLSHADVVPVAEQERSRWTHPPFGGLVEGGFVWGRGALDNKASAVCILEAIASMKQAGIGPRRDVLLLVGPDEETGGDHGTHAFVERHLDRIGRPELVIDEGSAVVPDILPGIQIAAVAVGEKRFVTVRASVQGHAGHSSTPDAASDAPTVLTAALGRLAEWQDEPVMLPPMEVFLDRVSSRMSFPRRMVLRNRWLFERVIFAQLDRNRASRAAIRNTWSLTILRAGVKDNVVPARAEALINLRLLPNADRDAVIDRIREQLGDRRVRVEIHSDWDPAPIAPIEGALWSRLESALAAALPRVVVAPTITPGTTDSRWTAQAGIPSYRFLPFTLDAGERARIHGIDERISIRNIEQGIRVYAHLLRYL